MTQRITNSIARAVGDRLGVNWKKVNLAEFRKGLQVEREHWNITHGSWELTAKIALAHLKEVPDYYTRLANVER